MTKWLRVNKSRRCPICKRANWCLVAEDGSAAICPRTPSDKRAGDAGYLHKLTDDDSRQHTQRRRTRTVRIAPKPAPRPDLEQLAEKFRDALDVDCLRYFAGGLGLSCDSLMRLGVGWSTEYGGEWSFPMRDGEGRVSGIRLRRDNGSQLAIRGSRTGLFIPDDLHTASRLLITEGLTDSVAALDLGFQNVIGRPNCNSRVPLVVAYVRRTRPADVVIVADQDEIGIRGADSLATVLMPYAPIRVVAPPERAGDLRKWKHQGATLADVTRLIDAAEVQRLRVKATT